MRNTKPFFQIDFFEYGGWDGEEDGLGHKFEFETMYLERNFTLGSVAAGRPNGMFKWNVFGEYGSGEMPFWEQSVWRLGVLSNGVQVGPQQVFGNTGREFVDLNGRSPYEQVGQGSLSIVRAFIGTDVTWISVPNTTVVVQPKNTSWIFTDFGHGVYAAFSALSSDSSATIEITQQPFYRKSQSSIQVLWTGFSNQSLSMATIEVGTQQQYSSFSAFQSQVQSKAHLSIQDHTATYIAATNKETVQVSHTGITTYTMVDGTIVSPAGKYPNVTINGTKLDFNSFESYQVVQGEPILDQPWGSGILTAQASGAGHRITVDSTTGIPTFEGY